MFASMGKSADDPKAQRSIIKRLASPDEVATVVAFSREAGVITGAPVRADGGVVMSIT
jgi:hypothetical protein